MKSNIPRAGISLIEVLIAISIVSLLVSLSIPAVQAAREASRKLHCSNNMRQYGLGFAAFESQRGTYPASVSFQVKGPLLGNSEIYLHNYMAELLPFLGEGATVAQYQQDALFCASQNHAAIAHSINIAVCPSSPERDTAPTNNFVPSLLVTQQARRHPIAASLWATLDKKYSSTFLAAVTDYSIPVEATAALARNCGYTIESGDLSGLTGMFPWPMDDSKTLISKVGVLLTSNSTIDFSRRLRAADVADGLSNTFILTEVAGRPDRWQNGLRTWLGEPLQSGWADPRTVLQIEGRGPDGKRLLQQDNEDEIYSFHPNCVNFLFADGHVQSVQSDIDARVVLAWLTPAGGD